MGRRRRLRLQLMLVLTLVVFLLELVAGKMTSSLTVLSHSFHTLSGALALGTDLVSLRLASGSRPPPARNTFGWLRVELLGALVDGIFLAGLCFTVLVKGLERLLQPRPVRQPGVLVGVGVAGLLLNLTGLYLFKGQGGHSSTEGGCPSQVDRKQENQELLSKTTTDSGPRDNKGSLDEGYEVPVVACEESHLNMQGVCLQALGVTLGSVIVLVNGLMYYTSWPPCPKGRLCYSPCVEEQCEDNRIDGTRTSSDAGLLDRVELDRLCWLLYLDPALCFVVVFVALYVAYPPSKESALILLQAVPRGLDPSRLRARLLGLEGVAAVHELHVWRLVGNCLVATAHVKCREADCSAGLVGRIGGLFCQEGIHATTVQPEFSAAWCGSRVSLCELACTVQCASKQCCSGFGLDSTAQDPGPTREASHRRPQTMVNKVTERPNVTLSGYVTAEYETTV
ncbi:proton-coupled zinc antiporter SLC30A1-like [Heptranchias perlo]|uniref:proton-coupled zinc antiporter SLC30A1-like n=1 Tax=Heptranchias perlo TaxID=212740 RepID=UPI00355A50A7